jgi:hypothetical protein
MKAIVKYRRFNKEQIEILNAEGWSSQVGAAYLAAGEGDIKEAIELGLYEVAAELDAEAAEEIFSLMQNLDKSWTDNPRIKCLTDFPRSMSVGDIIEWGGGVREYCVDTGWLNVDDDILSGRLRING